MEHSSNQKSDVVQRKKKVRKERRKKSEYEETMKHLCSLYTRGAELGKLL